MWLAQIATESDERLPERRRWYCWRFLDYVLRPRTHKEARRCPKESNMRQLLRCEENRGRGVVLKKHSSHARFFFLLYFCSKFWYFWILCRYIWSFMCCITSGNNCAYFPFFPPPLLFLYSPCRSVGLIVDPSVVGRWVVRRMALGEIHGIPKFTVSFGQWRGRGLMRDRTKKFWICGNNSVFVQYFSQALFLPGLRARVTNCHERIKSVYFLIFFFSRHDSYSFLP